MKEKRRLDVLCFIFFLFALLLYANILDNRNYKTIRILKKRIVRNYRSIVGQPLKSKKHLKYMGQAKTHKPLKKNKVIFEVYGPGAPQIKTVLLGTEHFKRCLVSNCFVTLNESYFQDFDQFDAVVIKPGRLRKDELAQKYALKPRNTKQRYVFRTVEAPNQRHSDLVNEAYFSKGFFNWTWTYRSDSDVINTYGYIVKPKTEARPRGTFLENQLKYSELNMSKKTNSVFWVVSDCKTESQRELYVEELRQYIDVDIYGKCGPLDCPQIGMDCHVELSNSYKFYLAFENTICNEYISEKFWRTLRLPLVPIVMGGSNYKQVAPPHSYIDVNDFDTVEDLADYIQYLDAHNEKYLEYFKWKENYNLYRDDPYCQLCQKLNDDDEPVKVYSDLKHWFLFNERNETFCK